MFTDQRFGVFYATRLRQAASGRVEASALHRAYGEWAVEQGDAPLGFKQLKAAMMRRGHRHFYSNRAWYAGVVLLPETEVLPPDECAPPDHTAQLFALDLVARIDAITADVERSLAELAQLRSRVREALQ